MTQNLVDDEAFNSWILGRTPAHRWGTVEDIVGPAVWLASDASNFVNGQVVFIDGGMTASSVGTVRAGPTGPVEPAGERGTEARRARAPKAAHRRRTFSD